MFFCFTYPKSQKQVIKNIIFFIKDKKIRTAKAVIKILQLSFLRGETNKAAFSFSLSYFPKLNSLCQKDWKIQFQIDKTFFQSPLQLS